MVENEIDLNDLDDLDISDKEEFLESLKDPPKVALDVFPVETWTQIISNIEDVSTLTSLSLTCSTLRVLSKQPLLTQMVTMYPLNKLYLYTKREYPELTNQKEIIFKMHKYIDKTVIEESDSEPLKWTDDMYEWDGYDDFSDKRTNLESFRKEVGRKGKAKSKFHIEWEINVENKKKLFKREMAKCWAVAGKMFPFSHAENREWKKRRQEKMSLEDNNESSSMEKENKLRHSSKQQKSSQQQRRQASTSTAQRSPKAKGRKDSEDSTWKFSHEIRNQSKSKRPNIGKGEEEFNRQILTNFVTPKNFYSGERLESLPHDDLTVLMIKILKRFDKSDERALKFPRELSAYQRKRLHRQAEILGLKSASFGAGDGRFLMVMRQDVEIFR